MDIIKSFKNNDIGINIIIKGTHEEPLFRAIDIGTILEIANIRTSIQDFDKTEKYGVHTVDSMGRDQETTFLTEKGLYQVLFTSRKPIAKTFKNWVCEVIKEIRINGKYDLENQLKLKNNELIDVKEKTMIDAYDGKAVVYIGVTEENVRKFGYSNDIRHRTQTHKREIGPQFKLEYIIETVYNRELESMIKETLKDKIISKKYLEKTQTELVTLDDKFTSKKFYDTVTMFKDSFKNGEMIVKLIDENEQLKKENILLKASPHKEDLANGNFIYLSHKPNTLMEYELDLTNDPNKTSCIYMTTNAKKIKNMAYIFLKPYKISENSFEIQHDKIKKTLEYCMAAYDIYDIDKTDNYLFSYLNRCLEDRSLLQKNKPVLQESIFNEYFIDRYELGENHKITIIQIYNNFNTWHQEKYGKNIENISEIKLKEDLVKYISDSTKLQKSIVSVTDNLTGKKYFSYPGFVGIKLKDSDITRLYSENIYREFIEKHIKITNDLNDKLVRIVIINKFVEWLKTTSYAWNPRTKGEERYTKVFFDEITSIIKNLTGVSYEADRHASSKGEYQVKGKSKSKMGYFSGLLLNDSNIK